MRALLFSAILWLLSSQNIVSAQSRIYIGPKAGLNFAQFQVSKFENPVTKIKNDNGYYLGIQIEARLNKKFGIQTEAFYIANSVIAYTQVYNNDAVLNSEYLKHFCIPLLAKFHAGHFGFYAGPQLAILSRVTTFDNSIPAEIEVIDESYRKTSFSGIVGLEYTFKHRFGIEARYQFGLTNISASNGITALTFPDNQDIKLNGFQAGLYYRFGKKYK